MNGLVIGGIVVPKHNGIDISQTYEFIGGRSQLRMSSGAARVLERWRKLTTTISAEGWSPDPLDAIDFGQPFELRCIAPRAVQDATNVITLPAARRSDSGFEPIGYAIVDGIPVMTGGSLSGDTLTLDTVTGADRYQAWYWPQLTVTSPGPDRDFDRNNATWRWTMNCEEA